MQPFSAIPNHIFINGTILLLYYNNRNNNNIIDKIILSNCNVRKRRTLIVKTQYNTAHTNKKLFLEVPKIEINKKRFSYSMSLFC